MRISQNESTAAKRRIGFQCVRDADGVSPMLGLSFSGTDLIVGKGFTEGSFLGTVGELINPAQGFYYYQPTVGEVDTLGPLTLRLNKADVRPEMYQHQVI